MVIETERLVLRKWTMDDIEALVDGLNDFDTAKNLTVPFPYAEKDAVEFISRHLKDFGKNFYFAVTLKGSGEVIGGTSLSVEDDGKTNNGGIWLHRNFRGMGYGTEVWSARAKFGFEALGLDELFNGFYDFNEISKKMQLKVGYKIVGNKKNFCPALKSEVNEIRTTLKKSDFYENEFSKIKVEYKN